MNIIRWIFGVLISIIIILIGPALIEPILDFLFSICSGYGRTGWADMPTEFGQNITFFNFSILPMCFAMLIAYGIGGYCCGKIIPKGNKNLIRWICGITITILNLAISIFIWDGKHWFYSSVLVIAMLIAGLLYVALAESIGNEG